MLRRLYAILLMFIYLLLMLPACAGETPEEPARYTAITSSSVEPRENAGSGKKLRKIRGDAKVEVMEYGEKWCRVRYRGTVGWVRTKYLWGFVSLDPLNWPSPQFTPCLGYVTLRGETQIRGGKFSGMAAPEGAVIAVYGEDLRLPVWRGVSELSADTGIYTPFTDWRTAEPGDLIAGFTTYYGKRTGAPLQTQRQFNIRLGCERIDGQTVEPEAEFSFNALCAPYKLANGYQVAKNISHDGKGPGGGVCQVSTTLYNALLSLPVPVTEWAAHRPSGVNYIPRSFDAAVGSTTDLKFRNTLPYPVIIKAQPQDGAITVLIARK